MSILLGFGDTDRGEEELAELRERGCDWPIGLGGEHRQRGQHIRGQAAGCRERGSPPQRLLGKRAGQVR